ncbi:Iron-sulfur cluster biosynthesis family protein [Perilla frutescens var. frutescens]|nr:Iron-sulfur cluster biosynthesis family protein [Perilla frutescens var. frutescens]
MASMSACFSVPTSKSRPFTLTRKPPCKFHYFTPLPSRILTRPTKFRCGRTSVSVIRAISSNSASVDVTTIRPGGIVESDKLPSDMRKRAMDAIDSSGRRVTVGDVASKAGLKLNEAQRALQALAADTDGFLEVSDEGDVLYVFPKDYRTKLTAKSLKIKFEPLIEKGKMTAEYLVRVTFGTALIASIVIVYTTIIAIISSSRDSDDRGRRGRSYDRGVTFFFSPTDLFWYWDPYYYRRRRAKESDGGMNFIESVRKILCDCGIKSRVGLIGQYIASNGGVVTAEELAPYLDLETTGKMDDDSYILPVLLRFDGLPEVDEEGNILYRFPSLQRTATPQRSGRKEYVGKRWADWVGDVGKFFKEKKWKFSKASASERAMVVGLGALNLFGVIVLGTMLKNTTVSASGFISFVSEIFPLLQIYAGSFFAIPLIRWVLIQNKNAKIVKRNEAREQRARALELPDLSLRRKILSARDMAQRTFIGQDRIVYSTERDLNDQDYEAREWERRLEELEKSD